MQSHVAAHGMAVAPHHLASQSALAVLREVLVDGVAGDQRVEARGVPARLGAQQPAEALTAGLEANVERLFFAGQSPREVGRALGMSEQSVAVLKRRALLRLRQSMAGL